MKATLQALALLWILFGTSDCANTREEDVVPMLSAELPFRGPGKLAVIVSRGAHAPTSARRLFVISGAGRRQLALNHPRQARWLSPRYLLVEHYPKGSPPRETVRFDVEESTGDVVSVNVLHGEVQPSRSKEWVAVLSYEVGRAIQVRRVNCEFPIAYVHKLSEFGGNVVWSPHDTDLLLALWTWVSADGSLQPQLWRVGREHPEFFLIPDSPRADFRYMIPLFWNEIGIFAESREGLLKCDPAGGCDVMYPLPRPLRIIRGVEVSGEEALLVVRDRRIDPWVRGNEVHRVDLRTGFRRSLVRLADEEFVDDLDWIAD